MSGLDNDICPPRDSRRAQALQDLGQLPRAAWAVGLENHRKVMHEAATRTKHGYAALAKAAGFEPPKGSDDEMGDLTVTGDQTFHLQQAPQKQGVPGWLAAALTAGGLGLGVAGSQLIPDGKETDPPPAVTTSEDGGQIGYSLEIK